MTRQNFIPASNPENPMILALIPYWDMGNHANAKVIIILFFFITALTFIFLAVGQSNTAKAGSRTAD